jgi:hypothetical protein
MWDMVSHGFEELNFCYIGFKIGMNFSRSITREDGDQSDAKLCSGKKELGILFEFKCRFGPQATFSAKFSNLLFLAETRAISAYEKHVLKNKTKKNNNF